jgi:putative transposase
VTRLRRPRSRPRGRPYPRLVPRPPRLQVAGGLYHLTSRANLGRVAFGDDRERECFLELVAETVKRFAWSCRAYCVLSTHYHLFVATPEADLAAGMQYLKGRYAQWANWSRKERGHLFEGRFRSLLVESIGHAYEVQRYIALNPVRAGIVRRPEEWPWASTRALLGLERPAEFLDVTSALQTFDANVISARRRFRSFLRDVDALDAA